MISIPLKNFLPSHILPIMNNNLIDCSLIERNGGTVRKKQCLLGYWTINQLLATTDRRKAHTIHSNFMLRYFHLIPNQLIFNERLIVVVCRRYYRACGRLFVHDNNTLFTLFSIEFLTFSTFSFQQFFFFFIISIFNEI